MKQSPRLKAQSGQKFISTSRTVLWKLSPDFPFCLQLSAVCWQYNRGFQDPGIGRSTSGKTLGPESLCERLPAKSPHWKSFEITEHWGKRQLKTLLPSMTMHTCDSPVATEWLTLKTSNEMTKELIQVRTLDCCYKSFLPSGSRRRRWVNWRTNFCSLHIWKPGEPWERSWGVEWHSNVIYIFIALK